MDERELERYGLRPRAEGLDERAASALVEHLRREREADVSSEELSAEVFENSDLFYVPVTWIECAGFLVLKPTLEVIGLGSNVSVDCQIWAHYRGLDITRSWSDLVIEKLCDVSRSRELLREIFGGRRYWNEVAPALEAPPPWRFTVELFHRISELMAAEREHAFEFTIEPATDT